MANENRKWNWKFNIRNIYSWWTTEWKTIKTKKNYKKYHLKEHQISTIKKELKQNLQCKAQRLRRFTKRNNFYRQNKIFETDAKKFYRKIGKNIVRVDKIPPKNQVKEFWKNTWGKEKNHKENARWINDFKDTKSNIFKQSWNEIRLDEITKTLNKSYVEISWNKLSS